MLLTPPSGPLVLGIALVDFNHLVGPKIEFYEGEIFEDEEVAKILPFLALPDGAHLVIKFVIMSLSRSYIECLTRVFFHLVFRGLYLLPHRSDITEPNHSVWNIASPVQLFSLLVHAQLRNRCNRQIAASVLLVKDADVTRSIVQKAVVVLASKPLFGPIRYVHIYPSPQPTAI